MVAFGFDNDPSDLSYMSGTAADALGLTQASGAINSSPGGQHPTTAQFMNDIVQNETNQFGSFQSNEPRFDQALAAWAQSTGGDGYQFLTYESYHLAGRIERTDDRSGRHLERSRSERAYAGGAGDLYTGHRGDLCCGGNRRPCWLL